MHTYINTNEYIKINNISNQSNHNYLFSQCFTIHKIKII